MTAERRVLITGCSSGIGRAAALAFVGRGWTVVATARRIGDLEELAHAGCTVLALDVTDEASMVAAVDAVRARHGGIDVLINNAGYGLYGAVERLETTEILRQFATNVFGPVRLSQLVLPMMRSQGSGRIVNLSSVAGRISLPMGGAYHASKHAVEAFGDALRVEVGRFGISVSLVEPGLVRTPWAARAAASIRVGDEGEDDPYLEIERGANRALADLTTRSGGRFASRPEAVARVLLRAAGARRPRSRYRVGRFGRVVLILNWLLPDRLYDRVVARTFLSL